MTAGDERAFAAFTERHRRALHVHCYRYRMLASFEEAEDAMQETFLRAWRSRERFDGGALARAWLYRIATNVCFDVWRQHARRPPGLHFLQAGHGSARCWRRRQPFIALRAVAPVVARGHAPSSSLRNGEYAMGEGELENTFAAGFTRDTPDDGSDPDAAAIRASTHKLLDLVDREQVGLVIFGHDRAQWDGLTQLPAYYE